MSLDQLEKVILAAAREQAEKVEQEAAQEIRKEEERVTQKVQEAEEAIVDQAHAEADQKAKLILQTSRLKAKSEILIAKQEELDALQKDAIKAILELPEKETTSLVRGLLETLPTKEKGILTVGAAHFDAVKKAADSDMYEISKDTLTDEGGFIFENDRVRIDCTISKLTADLMERHRADVAAVLFSA